MVVPNGVSNSAPPLSVWLGCDIRLVLGPLLMQLDANLCEGKLAFGDANA